MQKWLKRLVIMMSKYASALAVFIAPFFVYANVTITEIMYNLVGNDSGREWVEIYNDSDDVDITEWRFIVNGKAHLIKPFDTADGILAKGEYAIIADKPDVFMSEHSSYIGKIYDSAFLLNNSGTTLELKNENDEIINTVSYLSEWGASENDLSLQYYNHKWIEALPTPGSANKNAMPDTSTAPNENSKTTNTAPPPTSETGSTNANTGTNTNTNEQETFEKISVEINAPKSVIVGADTYFSAQGYGIKNKRLINEKYLWNFGDGQTGVSANVNHVYKYPGDYVVLVTVSSGKFSATSRAEVTAIEAKINLEILQYNKNHNKSYDQSDDKTLDEFVIKITNENSQELDLSYWRLVSGKKVFMLPKNTKIIGSGSIIFDNEVTHLDVGKNSDVSLTYQNGVTAIFVKSYNSMSESILKQTEQNTQVPQKITTHTYNTDAYNTKIPTNDNLNNNTPAVKKTAVVPTKTNNVIMQDNQSANVHGEFTFKENDINDSAVIQDDSKQTNKKYGSIWLWISSLFALMVVSAVSIILVKQSSQSSHGSKLSDSSFGEADEYKILG